jgi:hypothetical protein
MWIAGIVVVVVVVAFGGVWASGLLAEGGSDRVLHARATTPSTRELAHEEDGPCQRALTPKAPLRLWIGGDSLAGSLGPSLGGVTAETGVVQPTYDSRVSSGLSTPDFFDWPEHAAEEMARLDPEVVVFIIGANDWRVPTPKPVDANGEPQWRAEYTELVTQMLDTFEQGGSQAGRRIVYWVSAPTMEDPSKDDGVRNVNAVARAVVAQHPKAHYIDAYQLFTGKDGTFTPTLPGPNGKELRVRADDGIHLTDDGGDLLAHDVFEPLDARCHLDAQAVPGAAKQVLRTKGSAESGSGGSGGSTRGGPTVTSPPTAAPTVAPAAPPTQPVKAPSSPQTSGTTPTTPQTSPTTPPTDPPTSPPTDVTLPNPSGGTSPT